MSLDTQEWERLQALFHLADEAPPEQREHRLAEACADPELRERALAVVRAGEKLDGIQRLDLQMPLPPLRKIGQYDVLECLGSGGMGSVYLVERTIGGIRQRLALKALAPHAAGPSLVERFHREQQILASLEHPNITRILDAGVSDTGQPYLVMEYVQGQHLSTYCDQRKLSVRDRVRLLMQVCEVVEYAHRSLVVHLDLKPSNILITDAGVPKLLDFGASKLVPQDGRFTSTYSATPSYASPEQLRNDAVTTACDIYSLGVVMFELLSGARPAGDSSVASIIERAIEDRDPPTLREKVTPEAAANCGLTEPALAAQLSGDLTTIVSKCLRNQPRDRYTSAGMLAEDLRRYLDGRPVLARSQTTLYRLGKFVRRNRGKAVVTLTLLAATGCALFYAYFQQRRALEEGARAARTQSLTNQLFRLANLNFSGKQVSTLSDFLGLGVKMAPLLTKDPRQLAEIECSLAISIHDSGNLAGSTPVFEKALTDAHKSRRHQHRGGSFGLSDRSVL